MRSVRFVFPLLMAAALDGLSTASAQQVWTGLAKSFSKPTGADWKLPEYQDAITPNVTITRGELSGIFNIVTEEGHTMASSPAGTRWATTLVPGNADQTISATNWTNLSFTNWAAAYGGQGGLATNILTHDAVVHLVEDDIYLDLRFTQWAIRAGGFEYLRSEPIPEPATWVLALAGLLALRHRRR